jgi:hypothetical protein
MVSTRAVSMSTLAALALAVGACGQDGAAGKSDATTPNADIIEQAHGGGTFTRSCGDAMPGYVRCHALKKVQAANANGIVPFATTPGGLNPVDLISAYKLPTTGGTGLTIAIVDAMDAVNAESDLATYRSQFGLPACTTANGCFRKVNQNGAASPLPAGDSGWAEEISLDIDMASAICPSCHILLVEATSPTTANLGAAVNTAVSLGATVVSNSYGGSESSTDPTTTTQFYSHPGVGIFASSGDGGFGVEYPAASTAVMAVGGTHLVRNTSTRGWIETVWGTAANTNGGAGSGCSTVEPLPSFQTQATTGCARRAVADVSAVADPATGVSVFDTVSGGWLVFGGTSVASPVVASIFALTGHGTVGPAFAWQNTGDFFDVLTGTNGSCGGTQLCTARAGWDGPTGWGTPNGAALTGGVTPPPANDFSISATPASASATSGTAGTNTSTIATATTSGAAQTVSLSVSGGGTGVTASLSATSVTSGGSATLTVSHTAAAAAGTYSFTVTGTAASGSHSATYTLTLAGAGGACTTTTQLLVNPGFEAATGGWTATAGVLGNGSTAPNVARTGAQFAWMDGYGTTHTDTLTQSVAIPAGACTAVFTYWIRIQTAETTTTTAFDKLTLTNGATTLQSLSNLNHNTAYAQQSINLISFKGTTVTLKFTGTEDTSLATSFQIDDTAVTVTQ